MANWGPWQIFAIVAIAFLLFGRSLFGCFSESFFWIFFGYFVRNIFRNSFRSFF